MPMGRLRMKTTRALGASPHRHRVDGGGLQLGEVDVGPLGGRAVELLAERRAAREVGRDEQRLWDAVHLGRARGEHRHARVARDFAPAARPEREREGAGRGSAAPSAASTRSRGKPVLGERLGRPAPRMHTVRSSPPAGCTRPSPRTRSRRARATPRAPPRRARSTRRARPRSRRRRDGSPRCARPAITASSR